MVNIRKGSRPPPLKWYKYELLDLFGLTDIKYLHKTIHRLPWKDRAEFVSQLREAVKGATKGGKLDGRQHLFVVKFVPKRLSILLPNYCVSCLADLEPVERAIRDNFECYEEMWFCRTDVSMNCLSVAGRLLVDSSSGRNAHTIEQVWRCSPRLIESLGPSFPFPFVRGSRSGWRWSIRIEHLHIPPSAPETMTVIREQFAIALLKLDEARERLEAFIEAILALGLNICLEYKIEGERLQIIDWDTPNDSLVLEALLLDAKS